MADGQVPRRGRPRVESRDQANEDQVKACGPSITSSLPLMYRVVEGSQGIIPRLPSPSVQGIIRGKTRTRLATEFEPLQGEWLEAMDVEEYLEDRGIFLRGANSNHGPSGQKSMPIVQGLVQAFPELDYQQQQLTTRGWRYICGRAASRTWRLFRVRRPNS